MKLVILESEMYSPVTTITIKSHPFISDLYEFVLKCCLFFLKKQNPGLAEVSRSSLV